jgi:hypothetical protein
MAFSHGTWGGGAHFFRGGFPRHSFAISHGGFGQPFRRGLAFRRGFAFRKGFLPGGLWSYYGYDYVPTDALGDIDATTYATPEAIGVLPAPVCHRSEEMVWRNSPDQNHKVPMSANMGDPNGRNVRPRD